jgi:hypothetical protein
MILKSGNVGRMLGCEEGIGREEGRRVLVGIGEGELV